MRDEFLRSIGRTFPDVTMCEPSRRRMEIGQSMSSAVGSPVRIFQLQEKERESMESVQDCGVSMSESFASYDRNSSSWRTSQRSLFGGLVEFSETWPKSGLMRSGTVYRRVSLELLIGGKDCSFLPTPQHSDGKKWYVVKRLSAMRRIRDGRQEMLIHKVARLKGYPDWKRYVANPRFWEAVMGFPVGWTDLDASGMQ